MGPRNSGMEIKSVESAKKWETKIGESKPKWMERFIVFVGLMGSRKPQLNIHVATERKLHTIRQQ